MFNKRNGKYRVYHHMYGNVRMNNYNGEPSFSSNETPLFEGTRQQCLNWLKVQYLDAAVRLVDIEGKVLVDLDSDNLKLQIIVRKYYDDESYYFSSGYRVTDMF